MRHRPIVGLLAAVGLVMGLSGPPSAAAGPADRWNVDGKFRVEAHPIQKSGRTAISGYVYNLTYQHARVRLELEGLDAQGNVIGFQQGFVDDVVPLSGRAYFEVPARIPGAVAYKVFILWYDWIGETRGDFASRKW